MRIKKINYTHLDKSLDKLYFLHESVPGIKISKINKRGIITIKETKGFLFFRRKVRKHIYSLLFSDIIKCLSITLWGNPGDDIIKFYREELRKSIIYDRDEILNIKNIIDLLYSEWSKRTISIGLSKKENISIFTPRPENKKDNQEKDERVIKEVPNLLDLVLSLGLPKLKLTCKKMLITIYLSSLINSSIIFIKNTAKYNYENFKHGMRAPPFYIQGA